MNHGRSQPASPQPAARRTPRRSSAHDATGRRARSTRSGVAGAGIRPVTSTTWRGSQRDCRRTPAPAGPGRRPSASRSQAASPRRRTTRRPYHVAAAEPARARGRAPTAGCRARAATAAAAARAASDRPVSAAVHRPATSAAERPSCRAGSSPAYAAVAQHPRDHQRRRRRRSAGRAGAAALSGGRRGGTRSGPVRLAWRRSRDDRVRTPRSGVTGAQPERHRVRDDPALVAHQRQPAAHQHQRRLAVLAQVAGEPPPERDQRVLAHAVRRGEQAGVRGTAPRPPGRRCPRPRTARARRGRASCQPQRPSCAMS